MTDKQTLEDLVNAVDTAPRYFTRADGVRIALVNADFFDAIHGEHLLRIARTPEEGSPEHNEAVNLILGKKDS